MASVTAQASPGRTGQAASGYLLEAEGITKRYPEPMEASSGRADTWVVARPTREQPNERHADTGTGHDAGS
jgi:hypothetical protein